ncbi:OmpP1/FadL family transporter [Odoribacter sp. Z80]|uniref:OmpP1/FadL family transporter n=1 Tax=Odoribacter sp. Z80 TaxID=2304575 RepID=UPI0013798891|nr:outer membrane protein transport protein [Odoribacter sp. Z80]NCE71771.1 aromatic hydrocarbon degradation protein [Odoribacter sp. Z80]
MKKFFLVLLVNGLFLSVLAEGYQVNVLSTKQTGMGHVGSGMKLGAESMHFNPAGLVYLREHVDISLGVAGIFSNAKYQQGEYTAKTDNPAGTPVYGYVGYRIYDNLAAGISLTTPYGNSLEWPQAWKGAHLIQDISLKSYVLQPTVSYRIFDKLSIGAGLELALGKVTLSRALLPVGSLVPLLGPDYADVVPVSATLNGKAKLKVGYNIGVMYDVCDQVTLGLSYRSRIRMKVDEGTAELDYASERIKAMLDATGQVPPLDKGTFHAQLPLPSNTTFGVSYRPSKRWELALDLQFVGWQAYDSLNVVFNEKILQIEDIKAEKNYKNTMIYRVGAQYLATERLDVRMGIYYDQSPIRKHNYNPETPGMGKLGFSAGLSFEPYRNLQVDLAFLYIQGISRDGTYPDKFSPDGQFSGHYKSNASTVSIGLAYCF